MEKQAKSLKTGEIFEKNRHTHGKPCKLVEQPASRGTKSKLMENGQGHGKTTLDTRVTGENGQTRAELGSHAQIVLKKTKTTI